MVMESAAALKIKHMLDPCHLEMFLRVEQILRERRRHLATFDNQLAEIARETLIGARFQRLHRGDYGEGALHEMGSGVFEDEGEVPGQDARFGIAVVGADVVGGEVAEVFDEDFLGEGVQADEGGELVVVFGLLHVEIAAVEPVDEELEGGVVVFGQVELFGLGFGEFALEGCFEVVRTVAE